MNPIDYGCVCACLSMGLSSVVFAVCFARALWIDRADSSKTKPDELETDFSSAESIVDNMAKFLSPREMHSLELLLRMQRTGKNLRKLCAEHVTPEQLN